MLVFNAEKQAWYHGRKGRSARLLISETMFRRIDVYVYIYMDIWVYMYIQCRVRLTQTAVWRTVAFAASLLWLGACKGYMHRVFTQVIPT